MKTNFTTQTHLVLLNENGDILGVIQCPEGKDIDISEKLKASITNFYIYDDSISVKLNYDNFDLDEDSAGCNFDADITQDDECITVYLSLTNTDLY